MEEQHPSTILRHLVRRSKPFTHTRDFSNKPGIYGIGFIGKAFPLKSARELVSSSKIIYIGKTESSQLSRDLKTHFSDDKTGSSTLRRTLGAILIDELNLKPVPRSETEKSEKRFSSYKFDHPGERALTRWMSRHLSMSFWEYDGPISKLKKIETRIIKHSKPILNLKNNRESPWYDEIRGLRDRCAELARSFNSCILSSRRRPAKFQQEKQLKPGILQEQLKLHEAMIAVLRNKPNNAATAWEISQLIEAEDLYRKHSDGGYAQPSQISARARKYPKFFKKLRDGRIQTLHE